ncbi:hypothetical protein BJX64DRAFT_292241 [Aspergillus heterothallicus]
MRLHLPTLFSTLLAGSFLHHAAVSIPLRSDGLQSQALDIGAREVVNNWTVIDIPVPAKLPKRQQDYDPDDVLPGDESDEDVDLNYEAKLLKWNQAVQDGLRNIAKLENPPQNIPTRGYEPYHNFYQDERVGETDNGCDDPEDDSENGPPAMSGTGFYPQPMLSVMGIPSDQVEFEPEELYSKVQVGENLEAQSPVTINAYMFEYNAIVTLYAYRENDHNPAHQQIQPNELMLQQWDEFASRYDEEHGATDTLNKLEWIVQAHIINPHTQKILRLAAGKAMPGNYKNTLLRVTREEHPDIFHALSGTPNCKGIYPSLANHASGRFQNKRVTEMLIWKGFGLKDLIAMRIERQS